MRMLSANVFIARPFLSHSDSYSDSSTTTLSNVERSSEETDKTTVPRSKYQASKKPKEAEFYPKVSNQYDTLAAEDDEPEMELSNEDETYNEIFPDLPQNDEL
ncbi:hypothetical protein AVEN_48698-1 [Araneus ventricosus]|uniref:Uncharacterized protein n=1 Tax=Araneus ventricosus TaxID=182803 RepID=A0A4Y2FYH2_ARAVE|nr:hypothetical protein AVEN_48698-1 [Araneus ventricosus]